MQNATHVNPSLLERQTFLRWNRAKRRRHGNGNILQSLGDAMERQQQREHENNMEVLRAIYTRPGMIVLGVILLGAALALIWPQIAPEADNTNSIVIDRATLTSAMKR